MGLFGRILEKLGFDTPSGEADKTSTAPRTPPASAPASAPASVPEAHPATLSAAPPGATAASTTDTRAAAVTPMREIDVVARLEQKAAAGSQPLNWRTSIVDLLKLLDLDSSLNARKALAVELGCPVDLMGDSARMNTWLHKTVLAKLAANGGNVPSELLD